MGIIAVGRARRFPFLPTSLTNLVGWYRASSLVDDGLSDGGAISTWRDESGQGNDLTQGTGSKQPVLKTNIINGEPVVRLDGTDDWLAADGAASVFSGQDKPFTAFFVAANTGDTAKRSIWSLGNSGDANPFQDFTIRRTVEYNPGRRDDAGTSVGPTGGTPDSSFHILELVFPGTTITLLEDGTEVISSAAADVGTMTVDQLTLGVLRRTVNAQFFPGDVAEWGIYSNEKTDNELTDLRTYLNDKFAVF